MKIFYQLTATGPLCYMDSSPITMRNTVIHSVMPTEEKIAQFGARCLDENGGQLEYLLKIEVKELRCYDIDEAVE